MLSRRRRAALASPFAIGLVLVGGQVVEGCGIAISGTGTTDAVDASSVPANDATSEPEDASTCEASPTNPRACGVCGRDCGGGQCIGGACTPYVIAESIPSPWYLTVDATRVYVTSHFYQDAGTGDVYALSKNGGPVETIAKLADSFDVLVNGATLLASSLGERALFGVPIDGSTRPAVLWDGGQTLDLAHRDGTTYFTTRAASGHQVIALGPDGGAISLASVAENSEIEGVVADATHVYWASRSGAIGRMRRDGTERLDSWQGAHRVRRLAIDDEAIYWTSDSVTSRRNKNALEVVTLVDQGVGFGTIVVDATHAYVTLDTAGSVVRIDKRDGSGRLELATGLVRPMGLADDGTSIYFTERGRDRVWRMTK